MFDPKNWYWTVAGSMSQVYSSARNVYVPLTDAAYLAWLAATGLPTAPAIGAEADIWPYVSDRLPPWLFDGATFAQPAVNAYMPAQLIAYANLAQWAAAMGGKVIMIGGTAVPFATTETSLAMMNGKVARLSQPNPPASVNWQTGPAEFTPIDAADFVAAAKQVADFVQATFDKLAVVFGRIAAGTITTPAEIDTAFAGV